MEWDSSLKILVTGAGGFIGGALTNYLRNIGLDAIGLDNMSTYYSTQMKIKRMEALGIKDLVKFVDITDSVHVQKFFDKESPTHVIHLAAQGGVRASKIDPEPYLSTNQIGFLNIVNASEEFEVIKLVYASSSSVYGDCEQAPFREDTEIRPPKSLYALSKLSNELIAHNFPTKKTQRIGLRFFTVYGPWCRPDMAIFRLLASSILNKKFLLTSNLKVSRDFTYIEDVVRVVSEIIQTQVKFKVSDIFNVAGGNPYSMKQLMDVMGKLGINIQVTQSKIDPLDVLTTHASVEKLAKNNIWVPNTSLEKGILESWNWIKQQEVGQLEEWYNYFN